MVNLIAGDNGANALDGTADADAIYGFDPEGPQANVATINATRVATGLSQPLFAGAPDGDLHRLFIAEKGGVIKILNLDSGKVLATPFLNVTGQVSDAGEGGLLGFAFDPEFDQNGFVYINLINNNGDTEIRRYEVSAGNPNIVDPASATKIITIDQPAGRNNHKAGWLDFGPDGYLYAALGDGGGAGDPNGNAQNLDSLLGKILRLDVHGDDFPSDAGRNYAIPSDNPFAGVDGEDEIWALGLRNPFRDSFDRVTGTFFIADVGQNAFEEINLGQSGGNYGWDKFEGPAVFEPGTPTGGSAIAPIHFYNHNVGNVVTGGYAYRGSSDGLQGQYFFADFGAGKVFTLHFNGSTWDVTNRTGQIKTNAGTLDAISSFGEDGAGNLYAVDFDGDVFRLTPSATSADQDDDLRGLAGDDMLFGGAGADHLYGGLGADFLNGGAGFDFAHYDEAAAGVRANLNNPSNNTGEAAGDVYVLIEGLVGSDFDDVLVGTNRANGVNAVTKNDVLAGGAGDDMLYGLAGNDTLIGGEGADTLHGSGGIDTVDYSTSAAPVFVHLMRSGPQSGGDAAGDTLLGIENVTGSNFSDVLAGTHGRNKLVGLDGDDLLIGANGRDVLFGGSGADRFDFNAIGNSRKGAARDVIGDFSRPEQDKIDLSTIDANSKAPGNQAFKFIGKQDFHDRPGELHYVRTHGKALVEADINGDGKADFQIFVNLATLMKGDFIL